MLEISGYLNSVTGDEIGYQGLNQGHVPFWFMEIFDQERILVEAVPGILSVVSTTRSSMVLEQPLKYPSLIGNNAAYDRFFWGNRPADFAEFCSAALERDEEGIVLDIGGLSLRYSTKTYVEQCRTVVVIDRSLEPLKRARDKVIREMGRLPANIVFLQADYRDLPFIKNSFSMIFALDALNALAGAWELLTHCRRVLQRPGELLMTSLVLAGRWPGDQKLASLYRRGKLPVEPRSQFDLTSRLTRSDVSTDIEIRGNIAYISQISDGADEASLVSEQAA